MYRAVFVRITRSLLVVPDSVVLFFFLPLIRVVVKGPDVELELLGSRRPAEFK
jgi:hypothetical protein